MYAAHVCRTLFLYKNIYRNKYIHIQIYIYIYINTMYIQKIGPIRNWNTQ